MHSGSVGLLYDGSSPKGRRRSAIGNQPGQRPRKSSIGAEKNIGKVAGIYNFGAGDILEIKLASDGRLEMIPFNHSYVPTIDIDDGYIIVNAVSMQFLPEDEEKDNA